jgi:hypothetical protein
MVRTALIFLFLFTTFLVAKDIYVYDASRYKPFNMPSHAELLLDNYICMSGWVIFVNPETLITAFCHDSLMETVDPSFYMRWLQYPDKFPNDVFYPSTIPKIDIPWTLVGHCDDTLHVCAPPSENVTWSANCVGNVIETYALCSNAALIGMNSKMPYWSKDFNNVAFASYQLIKKTVPCPPQQKCQVCPDQTTNCTTNDQSPSTPMSEDIGFFSRNGWTIGVIVLLCATTLCFNAVVYILSYIIRRRNENNTTTAAASAAIELTPFPDHENS